MRCSAAGRWSQDADASLAPRLTDVAVRAAVQEVPDEWLTGEPGFTDAAALRDAYVAQVRARLDARPGWLPALVGAAREGLQPGHGSRRAASGAGRPAGLGRLSPGDSA